RARSNNEPPLENRLPASGSLTASAAPSNNDVAGGTSRNFHASTASRAAISRAHLVTRHQSDQPVAGSSNGPGYSSDRRRSALATAGRSRGRQAGSHSPTRHG